MSKALVQALDLVRPVGSIAKIGWGPQPLAASLDPLVAKAVTLYGSFSHTWKTWERVLGLFATGQLRPADVVGGVYGLDDWVSAFEDMERGRNIKSVVRMRAPNEPQIGLKIAAVAACQHQLLTMIMAGV